MEEEGLVKRQSGGKITRSERWWVSQAQLEPDSLGPEKRACCALCNHIRRFVICPYPGLHLKRKGLSGILSQMN